MMLLRSLLFLVLFYLGTMVQMVFWLPVFFLLRRVDGWKVVRSWGWGNLWLQHLLIGTRYSFRGMENIPAGEGFILASKHQSSWETYTTLLFLEDPSYIVKRELIFVPLFGWFAHHMGLIFVNRGKRSEALKAMRKEADKQLGMARQIVIYPEGTRSMAYAEPSYKHGITHMYENLEATILPAAINSGLFWPRNSIRLYQGTCILEFLPAIRPGLSAEDFTEKLQTVIESKSNILMAETDHDPEYDGRDRFNKPASA